MLYIMPIYPISFSIHESKIIDELSLKTQLLSITQAQSGLCHTPGYTDEKVYYNNYANSYFGKTCKKAGWDCMRHYEILANGCIPYFVNIDSCPKNTLTYFPKEIIKEGIEAYNNQKDNETCIVIANKLLNYTKDYLTTRYAAKRLLSFFNKKIETVLMLTNSGREDYLYNTILIGLKELIGEKCIDYPQVQHIYKSFGSGYKPHMHCRGFTITGLLPDEYNIMCNRENIEERITNREFDLVINAYDCVESNEITENIMNIVNKYYKPEEVVYLCGKDCDLIYSDPNPLKTTFYDKHDCPFKKLSNNGYNIFIRELGDE